MVNQPRSRGSASRIDLISRVGESLDLIRSDPLDRHLVSTRLSSGRMVTEKEVTTAAAEGFEAVTISKLADELGVAAGDISAHFATDELLQQSIVRAGADVFKKAVTEPAAAAPEGIEKLRALLSRWE